MNRRGFLRAIAAAPFAAVMAPSALVKPATGGVIRASSFTVLQSIAPTAGTIGLVGEIGPEAVIPAIRECGSMLETIRVAEACTPYPDGMPSAWAASPAQIIKQAMASLPEVNESSSNDLGDVEEHCVEIVEADIAVSPSATL